MWVSLLRLERFRNHADTSLVLAPGVTVLIGDNGQGKTNIVEALGYLAHGSSHRVSSDDAIVSVGHPDARVSATVNSGDRFVNLGLTIQSTGSNKAQVNMTPASLGELASWVNVVLFSPEDLAIVRSDPSHRRRFLDTALVSQTPRFSSIFSEYDKMLRQRNMLLKDIRIKGHSSETASTMVVWDDHLVRLSVEITTARLALLEKIGPLFSTAYHDIQPGHDVALNLLHSHSTVQPLTTTCSAEDVEASYRAALDDVRPNERDRATTLIGPHRDDLGIALNGLSARTHSSQGEAWSTALALKLAVARYHREYSVSGDPIIILDDVFSELDDNRRRRLAAAVDQSEQVLITAAVAADVPSTLSGRVITVSRGAASGD